MEHSALPTSVGEWDALIDAAVSEPDPMLSNLKITRVHYLLSSALDSFLSMQSNRLNITVQTLTSASIILMVLSLITGIYGTNFDNLPELHWTYGYFAMLGLMLALALGLYAFFKRKGWL